MIYQTNDQMLKCKTLSHWVLPSVSQVAVTAVAMTFDKDQTQEKPPDKSISKGLSVQHFLGQDFFSHTIQISKQYSLFVFILSWKIIIPVFSQQALATQNPTITFYFVFVGVMSTQPKLCNLFSGCSETEEQLQFPLELCTESSTNTQPSSKISGSHFLIAPETRPPAPVLLTGIAHFPPNALGKVSFLTPAAKLCQNQLVMVHSAGKSLEVCYSNVDLDGCASLPR